MLYEVITNLGLCEVPKVQQNMRSENALSNNRLFSPGRNEEAGVLLKIEIERQVENTRKYLQVVNSPGPVEPYKISEKLRTHTKAVTRHHRIAVGVNLNGNVRRLLNNIVIVSVFTRPGVQPRPGRTNIEEAHSLQVLNKGIAQRMIDQIADNGPADFGIYNRKIISVPNILRESTHVGSHSLIGA